MKFKTIESLLAGTPVVATTVGAEGIGGEELLTTVTDDPGEFAAAIVNVIRDPEPAELKAVRSRNWARATYGQDKFRQRVIELYGAA